MPFLLDAINRVASTHFDNGICDRSITVPTVTLNGLRQSLQLYTPGRRLLPAIFVMRSPMTPQRGQYGPSGHNTVSRYSRAASSSWKIGLRRSILLRAIGTAFQL